MRYINSVLRITFNIDSKSVIIVKGMGNNHNQYFGASKRKILLLGLEGTGKTTLLQYLLTGKMIREVQKTKQINIQDKAMGKLQVSFFDLPGAERQRVFWKQNYKGAQGVIYLINCSNIPGYEQGIQELKKCLSHPELSAVPFAIALSKVQHTPASQLESTKSQLQLLLKGTKSNGKIRLFTISYSNPKSIEQMMIWLINLTIPL